MTVIVEGDYAWQSPAAMGGFEEDGLRPWAEPYGPRNLFTTDAFRRPRAAASDIKRLLVADGEAEALLRLLPRIVSRDGRTTK